MKLSKWRTEFKRIGNLGMLVSIVGIIVCICFDSWNDLINGLKMNIGTVHYFFQNSAFGGVCRSYLLPVFITIPFSFSFCREYNSNIFPFIVAREGKREYCIIKYTVNALAGGIAAAAATGILFVFLASQFPIIDEVDETIVMADRFHYWIAMHHPYQYGIIEVLNGFLSGVLWSSIALCVSAYIPNSIVTMTSPYFASFVFAHGFRLLGIDNRYWFTKWLTGYSIIGSSTETLVLSAIVIAVLSAVLFIIFYKRIMRRIEYEIHS